MVKAKEEYWQDLIKQYESSGLSLNDFCKERLIPLTKFRYHWHRQMELEIGSKSDRSTPKESMNRFEDISILEAKILPVQADKTSGISIEFPNQVRCELNITVSCPEFGVLLKHLVALS